MTTKTSTLLNGILVAIAAIFGLAAGAAVLFYGEALLASAENLVVVVVPAVLATLFAFTIRASAAFRLKLVLHLAALLAAAYTAEALLSLGIVTYGRYSRGTPGVEFDTRSVPEVLRDLRVAGVEAYPTLFTRAFLHDDDGMLIPTAAVDGRPVLPLGGIANKITVDCNETGRYLIYETDKHGFHNPPGLWGAPFITIAAIGDSMAHGSCVRSGENFVALIRERFPLTVNLGRPDHGPLMELATLKEYLPALKPKIVLWVYAEENDLNPDIQRDRRAPILLRYAEQGFTQHLREIQSGLDRAMIRYVETMLQREGARRGEGDRGGAAFGLGDWLLLRSVRNIVGFIRGPSDKDIDFFGRVLEEAQATVSSWGGRLYFVYLPNRRRFASVTGRISQNLARVRLLHTLASSGKVSVIDLVPVFARHANPKSLFHFHYTPEGHSLAAAEMLRVLGAAP